MKIKQFRYDETNLGYLLWSGSEAAAIDGGTPADILDFAAEKNLELKFVTNTHEHWDHIHGNDELLKNSDAVNITPDMMCKIKILTIGNEQLEAFSTPGHSEDSIVFYFDDNKVGSMITGDTLFNGTVGNCYTKEYELYFKSLAKVLRFPTATKIYAGHDIFSYTTNIIKQIDPDNPYLTEYKDSYVKDLLVTTLQQELKVNPFIRFNDQALDKYRSKLGMSLASPYERWRAMMSVH